VTAFSVMPTFRNAERLDNLQREMHEIDNQRREAIMFWFVEEVS